MPFIYTPHKILFSIGILKIPTEPFFMLVSIVVFVLLVYRGLKKEKIITKPKDFFIFFSLLILISLFGGKVWYHIEHWKGLISILYMFNPLKQGLVSIGVFIGGFFVLLFYIILKFKKNISKNLAKIGDIIVVPLPLSLFIYRVFGCFINGHIIGKETSLPWGLRYADGTVRHPVAIYLGLALLVIFIVLIFLTNKKRFNGETALWFLLLYSFFNFWIVFLKLDRKIYFYLNDAQWVLAVLFVFSFIFLYKNYKEC